MAELMYLIIYDLPDNKAANKRRDRLHKLLSGYGTWTQYSVFECFLSTLQFTKLQIQIERLINPQEDSIRIYVLNQKSIKQTITYGSARPEKVDTLII